MCHSTIINGIFEVLPEIKEHHAKNSGLYEYLNHIIRPEINILFGEKATGTAGFGVFGKITFPFVKMGAITSLNLFELDELIILSFYWKNKNNYKKVLDIGANIGLHSLIMAKCGFKVSSYEPDPFHFEILKRNLESNNIEDIALYNQAMSTSRGEAQFIRVCGNTTGSHLAGCKKNPYGKLERFSVKTESFQAVMKNAELIKMDVEGHEKDLILNTVKEDWLDADMFVEIENTENRDAIFDHFNKININMFPQKLNWHKATRSEDLPAGYKEGMLFVSMKETMPW